MTAGAEGGDRVDRWLASQTLARATQRAYRFEVDRYERWRDAEDSPRLVTYLDALSTEDPEALAQLGLRRPLSAGSLQQAKRIVRLYLQWAVETEGTAPDTLAGVRTWAAPARAAAKAPALGRRALRHLVRDAPGKGGSRPRSVYRRAFARSAAFWLGMTPAELARLRRLDVRADGSRAFAMVDGERRGMPRALVSAWLAWLRVAPRSEFAISTLDGRPISPNGVAAILRDPHLPLSSRRLRGASIALLRDHGLNDDELRFHFRRGSLAIPANAVRSRAALVEAMEAASKSL